MNKILKVAENKFSLRWLGEKDPLLMDFNPIINKYKLDGNFVLIHWQAKPRFLRTWGLFDGSTRQYNVVNTQLIFPVRQAALVDVDERLINTVPTAMILYDNCYYDPDRNEILAV